MTRRNTVYTVNATVCTYDDPSDGVAAGTAVPANRCADNPTSATADPNGDDFRRFTVNLQWTQGTKTHTFKQTALIVNPSGGLGPRITSFSGPAVHNHHGQHRHVRHHVDVGPEHPLECR